MSNQELPFVGRTQELERLESLFHLRRGCLVVIKGRRRIGKSRLVAEFGKGKCFIPLSGVAPVEGVTAQHQRDAFGHQLAAALGLPACTFSTWSEAFAFLAAHVPPRPTVVLFDEISWMGSKDPAFLPQLKAWWDFAYLAHPELVLVLCGSVSTWIDDNIVNSTAFFGRVSLYIELGDLPLPECRELLRKRGVQGSDLDLFKVLAITGGVPWYLEQINPHESIDANIMHLCFKREGLFVHEFDRIFHDLFSARGAIYKAILHELASGMRTLTEIRSAIGYHQSGSLSKYMQALQVSGFVSKHYDWSLTTGKLGKQSLYRLCDAYTRFYLRYIEPNLPKIEQQAFAAMPLSALPGWEAMQGLQLETLLLKNRPLLFKALGVNPQDVAADNPYLQRATSRHKGCQIDYLVQTHTHTMYACEIKVRRRELGVEVIDAMQEKLHRFSRPKGYGICPVLLHLGPVSDALLESNYFYRIIDVADL